MDSKEIRKPMTAAERQRKRRQKLKDEGTYELYKKKHSEEVRKSRKKQKEALLKLPKSVQNKIQQKKRAEIRKQVALFRARKKEELKNKEILENTPTKIGYSASALGKATARARRNLPSSPRRKEAVLRRLYSLDICKNKLLPHISETSPITKIHSSSISPEHVQLVNKFYERDDISRQAPGRKDSITLKQGSIKSKIQVRHLYNSITETFKLFQEDHPGIKIGRSKFAELRPKHVLLSSKLPHNVCLCRYHDNFTGVLYSLHQAYPNIFPVYSFQFPESILCEPPEKNCWYNNCEDCKDGGGFRNKYTVNSDFDKLKYVSWYVWKSEKEERIQKVKEEGTIEELISHICQLAPTFLEHCYVKRHQATEYKKCHDSITSKLENPDNSKRIALIQVDFAENYTCKYQDEIQSAHWQQKQVSLFTVATWHSGEFQPCVLASDNTTHAKETVIAYIDNIFERLPKDLQEVDIWSDGPYSQFKNRYVAAALCELQKKYNFKILKWNFFATSHGKGPVDGIGGSVKRQVWSAVTSRKHIVVDAESFVVAANPTSNVEVCLVTDSEIEARNKTLQLDKLFQNSQAVPNISKIHQFVVIDGKLRANILSISSEPEDEIPKVGDWYFVEYENKLYPGEIKKADNIAEEYEVETMESIGKYWKWPKKSDIIFYTKDRLIKKLGHPIVVNTRGHFKFERV